MINNIHTVTGTLFSKDMKSGTNAKGEWRMCIVKIEADVIINGKTIKTICEYMFDWNVSFDEYSVGDHISADFFIKNKEIQKKDGTGVWNKEEKRIVFAKFADRDSTYDNHKGKIKVDAMSNIDTIDKPPVVEQREKVFVAPSPNDDDPDNLSDLPF
jgi:hypothetical protein